MSRVSREEIRRWLQDAKDDGATHLVVRSDDSSHEYYPYACYSEVEARKKAGDDSNMQSTIEVYKLDEDWEKQLKQDGLHRSLNF